VICPKCGEDSTLFSSPVPGGRRGERRHECVLALKRRIDLLEARVRKLGDVVEYLRGALGGVVA
jgi:hypothetical protein